MTKITLRGLVPIAMYVFMVHPILSTLNHSLRLPTFRPYIDTVLVFTSHFVEPQVEIWKKITSVSLYVTLTYLWLYEFGRCSTRGTEFKSPKSSRTRTHSPTHLFLFSWVTFELSTVCPSNNRNDFRVIYFVTSYVIFEISTKYWEKHDIIV